MFKSVISKTLVIASLLVGGFLLKVSAAPIAEDVNLYNHYNLFYGLIMRIYYLCFIMGMDLRLITC